MTEKEIKSLYYSKFVGFIKERNRPSGGIKTVHTVAVNALLDSSKKMLEIGSNTGFTSVNMSLLTGCEVVGIDPNKPSVDEAQEYAKTMKADKVSFINASALSLPFDDETFDVVWSSNVTSFINDKNKAISEYLRVLKPNGILVVVPIYYLKEPPSEIVSKVSEAIGSKISIWSKNYWIDLFQDQTSMLEKFFDEDYIYIDRQNDIEKYVKTLMEKDHLRALDSKRKRIVLERCLYFMELFNRNLGYAGYSIVLFQKRKMQDELELFISKRVIESK